MNDRMSNAPALTPELMARLRAIVGPEHALTDPAQQLPYLREWRDKYEGQASIVLRPGTTEQVSQILALAHEAGVPVVPQAGNTGLVGGQIPTRGRDPAVGRPPEARARRRCCGLHHDGRGRADARRGAGRRRPGRPPVPAQPAVGGQLPDRRQHRHQCRRHERARLRQRAPAGARAGGGAGRRPRLGRPQGPEEGQQRLRPEGPLHRLGRHARHHHGGRAQALSQAGGEGDRVRGAARPRLGAAALQSGAGGGRPWPHRLRGDGRDRPRPRPEAHARHARSLRRPASLVRADRDLGAQGRRGGRAGA